MSLLYLLSDLLVVLLLFNANFTVRKEKLTQANAILMIKKYEELEFVSQKLILL